VIVGSLRNYDIDMALMGRPPADFAVESEAFGPNPHVIFRPLAAPRDVCRKKGKYFPPIIRPCITRTSREIGTNQ
jgi:hypothetical protein